MMTLGEVAAAIKSRFNVQWAALHSGVTIVWANDAELPTFDVPEPVVHAEIRGGAENVAAWGGPMQNRYRQSGELIVRVFVPSNSGDEAARELADDAASIFRGWSDGDLRFFGVSVLGGSAGDESGNYFNIDVVAAFQNDLIA